MIKKQFIRRGAPAPTIVRSPPRVLVYCGRGEHQETWGGALARGLKRHNVAVEVAATPNPNQRVPDVEVIAFWGHRQRRLIDHQRRAGRQYLVLERGYFGDRFAMTSLGWDGLNGHANFCNARSPADRWLKHGWPLPDWREGGEYALICGQVARDAAVADVNLPAWYAGVTALIARAWPGLPVRFRPHPLARQAVQPPGVRLATGTLADNLRDAVFTVSYNSNTGVDSLLAGVPTYRGSPGSMAGALAPLLVNPGALAEMPRWNKSADRQAWAHDLAYCQWTHEEMTSGAAWDHIKRGLEAAPSEIAA